LYWYNLKIKARTKKWNEIDEIFRRKQINFSKYMYLNDILKPEICFVLLVVNLPIRWWMGFMYGSPSLLRL